MRAQGVTTFLDAIAPDEDLAAFAAVRKAGRLTARAHFAPRIEPSQGSRSGRRSRRSVAAAEQYDEGAIARAPGITVRNAKLFLDGVIAAPALTGAMIEPYNTTPARQTSRIGCGRTAADPAVYFPPPQLAELLIGLGNAGIDPHMHADGDGAVRAALDGAEALRRALPNADIRPAIAHDEIVDPGGLSRAIERSSVPVLSFQWGKPAGDTLGLNDYFGPARMKRHRALGRARRGRRAHRVRQRLADRPARRVVCVQGRRDAHEHAGCTARISRPARRRSRAVTRDAVLRRGDDQRRLRAAPGRRSPVRSKSASSPT